MSSCFESGLSFELTSTSKPASRSSARPFPGIFLVTKTLSLYIIHTSYIVNPRFSDSLHRKLIHSPFGAAGVRGVNITGGTVWSEPTAAVPEEVIGGDVVDATAAKR